MTVATDLLLIARMAFAVIVGIVFLALVQDMAPRCIAIAGAGVCRPGVTAYLWSTKA